MLLKWPEVCDGPFFLPMPLIRAMVFLCFKAVKWKISHTRYENGQTGVISSNFEMRNKTLKRYINECHSASKPVEFERPVCGIRPDTCGNHCRRILYLISHCWESAQEISLHVSCTWYCLIAFAARNTHNFGIWPFSHCKILRQQAHFSRASFFTHAGSLNELSLNRFHCMFH